ncbi:MAG: hypothetical protein DMG96_32110, partial [Acidobacteria bacterium]
MKRAKLAVRPYRHRKTHPYYPPNELPSATSPSYQPVKTTAKTTDSHTFSRAIRCFFTAGLLPVVVLILPMRTGYAGIDATRVAGGFTAPVFVTAPPGDTSRLFVVQQSGQIKIINLPSRTVNATPFLDISGEVNFSGEEGLLGLAFDP